MYSINNKFFILHNDNLPVLQFFLLENLRNSGYQNYKNKENIFIVNDEEDIEEVKSVLDISKAAFTLLMNFAQNSSPKLYNYLHSLTYESMNRKELLDIFYRIAKVKYNL